MKNVYVPNFVNIVSHKGVLEPHLPHQVVSPNWEMSNSVVLTLYCNVHIILSSSLSHDDQSLRLLDDCVKYLDRVNYL